MVYRSLDSVFESFGMRGNVAEEIPFTDGKERKSPFDDPNIVRPSTIDIYYERLCVENFCDDQDFIGAGYRRQAIIWHPDYNPSHFDEAEREFKAVDDAFQTLSDEAKKILYDAELRTKLGQQKPEVDWQEAHRMAQRASRYARSYVDNVPIVDSQLTPGQRAQTDYLDFLVDSGQIFLRGFGEVFMADFGKPCIHCNVRIPTRHAEISYKGKSTAFGDLYVHNFLAHGARAMVAQSLEQTPEHFGFKHSYGIVNHVYDDLGITMPSSALTGEFRLLSE